MRVERTPQVDMCALLEADHHRRRGRCRRKVVPLRQVCVSTYATVETPSIVDHPRLGLSADLTVVAAPAASGPRCERVSKPLKKTGVSKSFF